MNHILGLSFSDRMAHLIQGIEEQNIIKAESAVNSRFPEGKESSRIFSDENIEWLAQIILKFKQKNYTPNNLNVRIALPFSYAITKRIAIPASAEKNVLLSQVKWDLNNYLPTDADNYKVVKTDIVFEYPQYREIVFVAISKEIIRQVVKLVEKTGDILDELVLDIFCLERYLRANNLLDFAGIQVVLKMDYTQVAIHVYLEGKYYTSFIDPINYRIPNFSYRDKILELSKDKVKQIDNLIAQSGYDQDYPMQYFVHGAGLDEETFKQLEQEFNKPLIQLPANGLPQSESFKEFNSLEALGVLNIRTKL